VFSQLISLHITGIANRFSPAVAKALAQGLLILFNEGFAVKFFWSCFYFSLF
jgi:hypothetical protein